MTPCGCEGNRRSGVILANVSQTLMVLHLRAEGLEEGDEHLPMLSCGAWSSLSYLTFVVIESCLASWLYFMSARLKNVLLQTHLCSSFNKGKGKVNYAPQESVGGCSSPSSRPWARRWRTTNVCDAWPVWRQTDGYLSSPKASPPIGCTKLYCLVIEAHVC